MPLAPPAAAHPAVAPPAAPDGRPVSPVLRRVQRPRWRDTRLVVGILLVLVSVGVGARVVSGAHRQVRWVSTARDLPAGHVLAAGDLIGSPAQLAGASADRYFREGRAADLLGHALARPASAGELLPHDALLATSAPASRVVPVLVKAGRAPALSPGDHVDVYVLDRAAPSAGAATAAGSSGAATGGSGVGREVLVLRDVEFLGGTALGSGDTSAQLRVAPGIAAAAVAASQSERVDLVRVDAPGPGGRGGGPASVPGYGS